MLTVDSEANGRSDGGIAGASLSRDGGRLALAMDDGASEVWACFRMPSASSADGSVTMVAPRMRSRRTGRTLAAIDSAAVLWTFDIVKRRPRKLVERIADPEYGLSFSSTAGCSLSEVPRKARCTTRAAAATRSRMFAGRYAAVTVDATAARVAITVGPGLVVVQRCDECGAWRIYANAPIRARGGS